MNEKNRQLLHRAISFGKSSPQEALRLLEIALKDVRQDEDLGGTVLMLKNTGMVYYELGNFEQALKYYEEALSLIPNDMYLHFMCGELHSRLGEFDRAEFSFRRCLTEATKTGDAEWVDVTKESLQKNEEMKS